MIESHPGASQRLVCRVLGIARSAMRPTVQAERRHDDGDLVMRERIHQLVLSHPTFGYRRIWALLRHGDGIQINRKRVYRIMRQNRWMVHERAQTPRPRVQSLVSQAAASDERWATDLTRVDCGTDGWGHLIAVIDCHDRQIIGWELAMRGRAREAVRALEAACIERFGCLRPANAPTLRSDNGKVFIARNYQQACRDYGIGQEFITPYTPQQNGMIERFFRSIKEECLWQHNFTNLTHARSTVAKWIHWYNNQRPHQSLNYLSPKQFRLGQKVA